MLQIAVAFKRKIVIYLYKKEGTFTQTVCYSIIHVHVVLYTKCTQSYLYQMYVLLIVFLIA